MPSLPILPIWLVDLPGSLALILFSLLSLRCAYKLARKDPDNIIWSYLVSLTLAFTAFSLSRGTAHIANILLISTSQRTFWQHLSPYTGALNTATFIIIGSVTFFYHRVSRSFFLVRDYSDRITDAYRELRANQDKIIRLERQAIVSRMAAGLAHETRNPLMVIGGFARSMKGRVRNDPKLSRDLDIILSEAVKLEKLSQSILKAGKEMVTVFQDVPVSKLLAGMHEAVMEKARLSQVDLSLPATDHDLHVNADPDGIVMALSEIIVNAVEASPREGEVTVTVREEDEWAVIAVHDQGPGIPEDIVEHIFDPAFSTKKLASGLGLSFVREVVRNNGGRIGLETSPERGTHFFLYLPLVETQDTQHKSREKY